MSDDLIHEMRKLGIRFKDDEEHCCQCNCAKGLRADVARLVGELNHDRDYGHLSLKGRAALSAFVAAHPEAKEGGGMIQIVHIPGIQYGGETPEQAEERDRRVIEANRALKEQWESDQRQRLSPMPSMRKWAEERGIRQSEPAGNRGR